MSSWRHLATKERLVTGLTLLANFGTVIGIVLVIIQLQQNQTQLRAQTRHELAMGIVDQLSSQSESLQLVGVLRRGSVGEPLTPDEHFQYRMRSNAMLRYWENVHYQYRQGLYDESEFASHKAAWRDTFAQSVGLSRYWCEVRGIYSVQFAVQINSLLKQPCGPAIPRQPG